MGSHNAYIISSLYKNYLIFTDSFNVVQNLNEEETENQVVCLDSLHGFKINWTMA